MEPALERTGLSAAMPAAGVHAMAQGPLAAGGSSYYADLVVDALRQSGYEPRPASRARLRLLVRPRGAGAGGGLPGARLARLRPDPGRDRVGSANLPGIAFAQSPEQPPLPYADHRFDFVFAISIWSHFAEPAALAWLAEMRRILRPGGRLVLTTHGQQTITHSHARGPPPREQLAEVRDALFEHGFWYAAEFGEAGDHGVGEPRLGHGLPDPRVAAGQGHARSGAWPLPARPRRGEPGPVRARAAVAGCVRSRS